MDSLYGQRSSVVAPEAVVLKSFQDLLSLSKVPLSLTPSAQHDITSSSVPKTAASRLILDWDLLNDSSQLWNLMGVFSANEIASVLTATQISFGI